jgi:LPXTG-motif cell wall-anchored protein
MVGATSALAFAAPASATQDDTDTTMETPFKSLEVSGVAECDAEAELWNVTWTVTNTSLVNITAEITDVIAEGELAGDIVVGGTLEKDASVEGTQTLEDGAETAELTVELTWSWKTWSRHGWKDHSKSLSATGTVELGDCNVPPPPPPPEPPVGPEIVVVYTCDLLAFIVDNSEGDAEAVVTFTPNETATHGHATGFSYTIGEDGEVEATVDEGAGIETEVGEADSENPVELTFAAGAESHTHAFEAFAGLEVTVEMTLDGEPAVLEEPDVLSVVVSFDEGVAELDCEEDGEGGELPTTGMSTGLIALGALALLAVGGGLFLVARRRRITFTA